MKKYIAPELKLIGMAEENALCGATLERFGKHGLDDEKFGNKDWINEGYPGQVLRNEEVLTIIDDNGDLNSYSKGFDDEVIDD